MNQEKKQTNLLKNKNLIGAIVAIVVMAVISLVYFYPDAINGNVLQQHDSTQGIANGQEAKAFTEATGEVTRWTNSLFSGMPTFQISPSYESTKLVSWIGKVYGLGLPAPANLIFMMMIGFFILMLAFKARWYVALFGAIAYAFSTYFFIIIGAGHIWKFATLTYVPPTIAGIVWCYRKKYALGGIVAALAATMQLASNHFQMTYYFAFLIVAMAIGYLVKAIKEKTVKDWGIGTGVLAVAAILAVAANAPNLYSTYEYSKETMRGGHSEITTNADVNAPKGLDKSYITAWSYGIDETASLIVPNVKGGATIRPERGQNKLMSLAETKTAQDLLNSGKISGEEYQYLAQFPQYFGDQPMTNGPVYVGVVVFALFLLGCITVKGAVKWALLVATLLSLLMGWGHNAMWFTDMMIDHFPLYNKFRTVASAFVVLEFTIPLLAALALNQIFTEEDFAKKYKKAIIGSFAFTALACLLIYIAPGMFDGFSQQERDQYIASGVALQVPRLFEAIKTVRLEMVSADALRSLVFVIFGFGALLLFFAKKLNDTASGIVIAVVILVDMFSVNKRYISTTSFTSPMPQTEQIAARPVDKQILQDTTMNYRVVDFNKFGEATPSYYHKMIGGYHAAKLTRYQDLIDHQINKGNMEVLNMLNAKYFIINDNEAQVNPDALGNAWWVEKVDFVATPNEEMAYLTTFNADSTAVADVKFKEMLGDSFAPIAQGDTIYETTYAPNELNYHAVTQNGGVAVFSEVYFPWGWKATIDGQPAEIARVNYVLRALKVPAGEHTINFKFEPDAVITADRVAYAAISIIYMAIVASIGVALWRKRKDLKKD
jgi:hypothetical protein